MKQMSRRIEVEPGGARPPRLNAAVVGNGNDNPPTGTEDPSDLLQGSPRIGKMLQNVPENHLIEVVLRIGRFFKVTGDADGGSLVCSDCGLLTDLESVDLEAAVGQR